MNRRTLLTGVSSTVAATAVPDIEPLASSGPGPRAFGGIHEIVVFGKAVSESKRRLIEKHLMERCKGRPDMSTLADIFSAVCKGHTAHLEVLYSSRGIKIEIKTGRVKSARGMRKEVRS